MDKHDDHVFTVHAIKWYTVHDNKSLFLESFANIPIKGCFINVFNGLLPNNVRKAFNVNFFLTFRNI